MCIGGYRGDANAHYTIVLVPRPSTPFYHSLNYKSTDWYENSVIIHGIVVDGDIIVTYNYHTTQTMELNMELNITEVVKAICTVPSMYSASRAELGDSAGKITWSNAITSEGMLLNGYDRDEFVSFILSWGAWSEDDVNQWGDNEIRALVLQFIASELRECKFPEEFDSATNAWWEHYYHNSQNGQYSGRMFRGDDNEIYYYLGE